ncbi:MAG: helix-turn-helix domain-containing protein [Chitinophaga sp.]|uniref:helix-turn-helix domain-containing protein n=1 Tax=Chitinophaga sp. TaxID=1869181 RepID=UPI0025BA2614|nr:AraC family transcriptional regulator [Chitinophaga sp.]MBV8252009.1 helix-turn-helix domain-containing protein [Chitinophaga sp.]
MKTHKFHKTECGVPFLLNVLPGEDVKEIYLNTDFYNTDFFEIIFFKRGKGKLFLNQESLDVKDNSVFFISAFQERRWVLEGDDVAYTILVFQEEFLNDFFSDKLFTYRLQYFYQYEQPLMLHIGSADLSRWCSILMEIKGELLLTRPDSEHIIRSLLYYLLQTLNRKYADAQNLPVIKTAQNHAFQFKKLLETNIRQRQRVNDYADMLGISRISLNKAVKSQFNITATELLKQRLLFEVQTLLVHANKSISEISFELGFSEPHHLLRFFKTQTGITPSQYLKSYTSEKLAIH